MEQSKNTTDNPVYDLQVIIKESTDWKLDIDENKLMEKLTIYVVKRDGEVLAHGIKVGRQQRINEISL